MAGVIRVRNSGALSLVQDTGRAGFQRYGVSVSGAADREALLIGNLLVGNSEDAAGIEITFGGAEFEFAEESVVAITGGDLQPSLDGTPLSNWQSFVAPAGSVLRFSGAVNGLRSYIAVSGGIATKPVLGSRATHVSSRLGGLNGAPLATDDELPVGQETGPAALGSRLPAELRPQYGGELILRVVPGPQRDAFTESGIETFLSSAYTVTESSDRQGLRLDGPELEAVDSRYGIVSDAVVPGAIQVPGDRKPIILLADSQTTGGYPKIGVVASVDLSLLAQATPGTVVRFEDIDVAEAQRLVRERRNEILNADLQQSLRRTNASVAVNGEEKEIALCYSGEDISNPDGAMVVVSDGGSRMTVRVHEVT